MFEVRGELEARPNTLNSGPDVPVHSFFQRVNQVAFLSASQSNSELREQTLTEIPECVLDGFYLVSPTLEDRLDTVLDRHERL